MYRYKYILRFNAIHGNFDGTDKHVHTYRVIFFVSQKDTGYSMVENFLKECCNKFKNKDLDELFGHHLTLEEIAERLFIEAEQSNLFNLLRIEISNAPTASIVIERE